ncbi:hypothetical protein XELAEV_18020489mg [Xenopus laevis]|uniref:Secreted protein n=1 Tax=Xenopus laevis TaxID=8355 RepID=A0A974D8T2_XENLA|nr:hypothetical protein XELAEV_18020489mg [Xenopus laevis]
MSVALPLYLYTFLLSNVACSHNPPCICHGTGPSLNVLFVLPANCTYLLYTMSKLIALCTGGGYEQVS